MNRTYQIGCISIRTSGQRVIARTLTDCNWETGRKAADSVQSPALSQTLGKCAERTIEGNGPVVAHDKVVSYVVGRKRSAQPIIGEIDPLTESGRVVDGFGKSICSEESEIGRLSLNRNLERVVVRIGNVSRKAVVLAKSRPKESSSSKNLLPIWECISVLLAIGSARGGRTQLIQLQA
jgi:hypothetical protein